MLAFLTFVGGSGFASEPSDLFTGFAPGWRTNWREERLARTSTLYAVAEDNGRRVLHATSRAANAGLLRRFEVERPTEAVLRWRWKVPHSLAHPENERKRAGDDYAARVFVVFETSVIPLRTRAINYVWAAREKAGTWFPSPYTRNVGICVVRTGDSDAGRWLEESRDVLADYRLFFGEPPSRISAVAVLVDTDNTGTEAEAWFSDLVLATTPTPKS